NFEMLRAVLETPAPGASADSRKAALFYTACMDESTIERKGLAPVAADLLMLDASQNPDDLPVVLARLHEVQIPAFFRFSSQPDREDATHVIASVDQSGLTLPDRDLYLSDDERSRGIRTKYAAHLEAILRLAEEEPADAAAHAKTVLAIETA